MDTSMLEFKGTLLVLVRLLQCCGLYVYPLEKISLKKYAITDFAPTTSGFCDMPTMKRSKMLVALSCSILSVQLLAFNFGLLDSYEHDIKENILNSTLQKLWLGSWLFLYLVSYLSIMAKTKTLRIVLYKLAKYRLSGFCKSNFYGMLCFKLVLGLALSVIAVYIELFISLLNLNIYNSFIDALQIILYSITWPLFYWHMNLLPWLIHFAVATINEYFREQFVKSNIVYPLSEPQRSPFKRINASKFRSTSKEQKSVQIIPIETEITSRNLKDRTENLKAATDDASFLILGKENQLGVQQRKELTSLKEVNVLRQASRDQTAESSEMNLKTLERVVLDCDVTLNQLMSVLGLALLCQTVIHCIGLIISSYEVVKNILAGNFDPITAVFLALCLLMLCVMHLPSDEYNKMVSAIRMNLALIYVANISYFSP